MEKVISAGIKYGLKPKVHVNQFTSIGGVQNVSELVTELLRLQDKAVRKTIGANALANAKANQGALERVLLSLSSV